MRWLCPQSVLVAVWFLPFPAARAEEVSPEQRRAVQKGLAWLAKQQFKDGHWEALAGQYPMAMTGLGGMALLMEGSTLRQGRYQAHLRRATDYLLAQSKPSGMIGNRHDPGEASRYMYGHGYALLFLSCIHGEEEDGERYRKLDDVLTRAVQFSAAAQTRRGGWGYISASEGNDFDEGSVIVTQVQALRAAQLAGIRVPSRTLTKARKYLADATNSAGGVVYSLGGGGGGDGRPAITATAIVCGLCFSEDTSPLIKKWITFCRQHVPEPGSARMGYDEFTQYYYAQAIYQLGDDRYVALFPNSDKRERLQWSSYRKALFDVILHSQENDGSWTAGHIAPVYNTSLYLSVLQLDYGLLPIYQR